MAATENWSERTYSPGVSAQRGFTVTDAADMLQAISMCNAHGAAERASFILDRDLVADPPQVEHLGPTVYSVIFNYSPEEDVRPPENESGGVDRRPIFDWEPGLIEIPADRTAKKEPLVNAVGDVFDPPLTRFQPTMFLTYTRWDSAYDVQMALEFMGKKNANALSINTQTGPLKVEPGQMFCHSIRPAQPYRSNARAVPIAYRFEFRKSFKRRVLNAGMNAWYRHGSNPVALGRICNAAGEPIAGPVRLDKEGKPMNKSLKVLVNGQSRTNAAPVTVDAQAQMPPLTWDPDGSNDAVWILFDMIEDANFAALGL
jgi:hypothetical protein